MIKIFIFSILSLTTSAKLEITEEMKWNEYNHAAYQQLPPMGSERVTSQLEVKSKPIIRDQDGFGSCYLFATTSLLDQACIKSGACDEDKQISVLDVLGKTQLQNGNSKEFLGLNGGNIPQVTRSLTNGKKVDLSFSTEECAPYQQIENYNGQANGDFDIEEHPQLKAMNDIYYQVKKETESDGFCRPCNEEFFKKYYPFSTDMIENLSRAATKIASINAFEEFLNEVLIPKKCRDEKEKVKIPGVKFHQEHISDKDKFRKKMIELFENDQSAAISSCTWQRYCEGEDDISDMSMCPQEKRKRSCGAHAYLLSGFRTICDSNGECRNQYKVHNSWGTHFNVFNDNGWVEEGPLFDAYKDFSNQLVTYVESEPKKIERSDFSRSGIYYCDGVRGAGDNVWANKMQRAGHRCYLR